LIPPALSYESYGREYLFYGGAILKTEQITDWVLSLDKKQELTINCPNRTHTSETTRLRQSVKAMFIYQNLPPFGY